MSLGISLNKYRNAVILKSKTSDGLLALIQQIKCAVEVIQVYHDGGTHYAWIVTERKLIKKLKQE